MRVERIVISERDESRINGATDACNIRTPLNTAPYMEDVMPAEILPPREIPLSQGYVAIVDAADYERVSQHKWHVNVYRRRRDKAVRNVYAARNRTSRNGVRGIQQLHRFILDVDNIGVEVDHINHDGLDCRRENLRVVTRKQNQANSRKRVNNKSGFKGVVMDKDCRARPWRAVVGVDSKHVHIGRYATAEEAARAYDAAVVSMKGEFAFRNFPEGS